MVKKQISLNVFGYNNSIVNVNDGENSRELEISFINDEIPFDLSNKSVSLYVRRADNVILHSDCQVVGEATGGKVLALISSDMSSVQGLAHCEFVISSTNQSETLKVLGLKLMPSKCNTSDPSCLI